jgi:hypothetical protein
LESNLFFLDFYHTSKNYPFDRYADQNLDFLDFSCTFAKDIKNNLSNMS